MSDPAKEYSSLRDSSSTSSSNGKLRKKKKGIVRKVLHSPRLKCIPWFMVVTTFISLLMVILWGLGTDQATKEVVWQMQQFRDGAEYVSKVLYIAKAVKMGIIMPTVLIMGTLVCLACWRRRQEMEITAMRLKADPGAGVGGLNSLPWYLMGIKPMIVLLWLCMAMYIVVSYVQLTMTTKAIRFADQVEAAISPSRTFNSSNAVCGGGCIDVAPLPDIFNQMLGLAGATFPPVRCFCMKERYRGLHQSVDNLWHWSLPAFLAMVVLIIISSFQLMHNVAGFIHAKRDEQELMGESLQQEPPQQEKKAPQPPEQVALLSNQVPSNQHNSAAPSASSAVELV